MGTYKAQEIMKLMTIKNINIAESKALILGLAFKENCPDIRNTRVIDILKSSNYIMLMFPYTTQ